MPTLEQLLADTAVTDDIEINFGEKGKVKVGDLRAFAKAKQEASDAAQREAAAKRKEYEEAATKAKALAADSLKLFEQTEKEKAAIEAAKRGKVGDIDWDNDPVYKPVRSLLSKELEPYAQVAKQVADLQKAMAAGYKFIVDDYNERRWNSLPKEQRGDKQLSDFLKIAEEKNIRDSRGLFDPVEAFNRETADSRRAAELKEAEKRGAKEAEEKLRAANLARPGSTPRVPASGAQNPKIPKFGTPEWTDAVLNDPEIQRIAAGEVQ